MQKECSMSSIRAAVLFSIAAFAAAPASAAGFCATPADVKSVASFYDTKRPGVPLPISARAVNLPEETVASALAPSQALGTPGSVETVKKVWASIDAWGPQAKIWLVFTMGGAHSFVFPSLVPITQPSNGPFYDAYADEGRGVHGHLKAEEVKAIYVADIPMKDASKRTRTVSFYDGSGKLIVGVYASLAKEAADETSVAGFAKTWELFKTLPRLCKQG
jgi:putative heme iron utilization protein